MKSVNEELKGILNKIFNEGYICGVDGLDPMGRKTEVDQAITRIEELYKHPTVKAFDDMIDRVKIIEKLQAELAEYKSQSLMFKEVTDKLTAKLATYKEALKKIMGEADRQCPDCINVTEIARKSLQKGI